MAEYRVAQLNDIEETNDGRCPWRPVRHHLGIASFGINAWTAKDAGDRIINEHDETDEQEELYLVQQGRARFELNGESVDAPAGTFVFAEPGVKRTAFAEEPGTTVVVVGGTPGQAYEVSGWETWMPFHGLYEEGKYAEAADASRETVEAAGYAMPLYNLACVEALAGRKEDAMTHLRAAFEASPSERLRETAAADTDLDPIRDEPGFKELVEAR
jgi:mannose-6-phosphate isomerase-like protein (cupin superfamily)